MSQQEQLDVSSELAAPAADQQPQHSREGEIGERKEHAPDAPIARHEAQQEQERRVPDLQLMSCGAQRDLDIRARAREHLSSATASATAGATHRTGIF
jgi:hypothetical protein